MVRTHTTTELYLVTLRGVFSRMLPLAHEKLPVFFSRRERPPGMTACPRMKLNLESAPAP